MAWRQGPDLPDTYLSTGQFAMTTTPDRTGALLIGGIKALGEDREDSEDRNEIAIMRCHMTICNWSMLTAKLKIGRSLSDVLLIPKSLGNSGLVIDLFTYQ